MTMTLSLGTCCMATVTPNNLSNSDLTGELDKQLINVNLGMRERFSDGIIP